MQLKQFFIFHMEQMADIEETYGRKRHTKSKLKKVARLYQEFHEGVSLLDILTDDRIKNNETLLFTTDRDLAAHDT